MKTWTACTARSTENPLMMDRWFVDKKTPRHLKPSTNWHHLEGLPSKAKGKATRAVAISLLVSLGWLGRPSMPAAVTTAGVVTGEFPAVKPDDSGEMAKLTALRTAPKRRLSFPPVRQRKPKPRPPVVEEAKPVETTTTTTTTTEPPVLSAPNLSRAERLVSYAKRFLGVPYVYGGESPSGFDCSGFTQYTYRNAVDVDLPRTSQEQATVGRRVYSLARARLGDLIFFNSPVTHVGIYIGNDLMIASPHTGSSVHIQSVYETPSIIRRLL